MFVFFSTKIDSVHREPNDIDVAAVYHQLVDVYHSSESENDNESDIVPSTSTGPSTSAAAARARQGMSSTRRYMVCTEKLKRFTVNSNGKHIK